MKLRIGSRAVQAHRRLFSHYTRLPFVRALEIGAAQLRYVTEIAPKSPFMRVNRRPDFRADTGIPLY